MFSSDDKGGPEREFGRMQVDSVIHTYRNRSSKGHGDTEETHRTALYRIYVRV